ncbi:hypothetical protein LIER_13714 [Lithospermum erythrorhizon]|uniref:Reverse transcriptase domain-containing protein n=1 Tax=Lithospermum erythrorhizon TaxID=34254 RepID=A0AAV3PWF0_LITER
MHMDEEEENECPPLEVETNAENPQVNLDQVEAEVSFNALTTPNSFSTFRLRGVFGRTPINLLVDIGSTHTFLDEDYSPVKFNFKKTEITLCKGGQEVTLQAVTSQADLQMISAKKLSKWLTSSHNNSIGQLFSIQNQPPPNSVIETIPHCHPHFKPLLLNFQELFSPSIDLPPHRNTDHTISPKPEAQPISELLSSGFIQPSNSAFASPVILVKKKDGTWRFCRDYRYLNELTVKHDFLIPIVDNLLDELQVVTIFSKIDLRSGYYQIRMNENDMHKISFKTHQRHYEFLVMPFGLSNAPTTFQGIMNHIFSSFLRKFVLVFFDDILIYSKDIESHIVHFHQVLIKLRENRLFAKPTKCAFGQPKIKYLGHIITASGVQADPSKIEAMLGWPSPNSLKSLRRFLGLTGYYRKFIKGYGIMAKPLTNLLKKMDFSGLMRLLQHLKH